jgi:hypothetical protein
LRAVTTVEVVRNAENRLRIGRIGVDHYLGAAAAEMNSPDRVVGPFEKVCIVTQAFAWERRRRMFHRR